MLLKAAQYALDDPKEIVEHFKATLTAGTDAGSAKSRLYSEKCPRISGRKLKPRPCISFPRIDDTANNQIYLNLNDSVGNELMPTLAHEGYPGHMYQITYYYNTNPDPIRTVYESSGYVEGWASYAEALSYDYCGFEEDVAEFYKMSFSEMTLNLYCRTDLGIHYEGWGIKETGDFLCQYLAVDEDTIQEVYDQVL